MSDLRQKRNLAYEIGLCRIALVVDQVHRQIKTHHLLAKIFRLSHNEGEQRARLTYFWWVVLGGNRLRAVDLQVIPRDVLAGINPELLRDWFSVFCQAAVPIPGEEFTRAWMAKAEQLSRKLRITDEDQMVKLAKAS